MANWLRFALLTLISSKTTFASERFQGVLNANGTVLIQKVSSDSAALELQIFKLNEEGGAKALQKISSSLIDVDSKLAISNNGEIFAFSGSTEVQSPFVEIELIQTHGTRRLRIRLRDIVSQVGAHLSLNPYLDDSLLATACFESDHWTCESWIINPQKQNWDSRAIELEKFEGASGFQFVVANQAAGLLLCQKLLCNLRTPDGKSVALDFPSGHSLEWGNTEFGGRPISLQEFGFMLPFINEEKGYSDPTWCHYSQHGTLLRCLGINSIGGIYFPSTRLYYYSEGIHLNTARLRAYDPKDQTFVELKLPESNALAPGFLKLRASSKNYLHIFSRNVLLGESISSLDLRKYQVRAIVGKSTLADLEERAGQSLEIVDLSISSDGRGLPTTLIRPRATPLKGIVVYAHGGPGQISEGLGSEYVPDSEIVINLLSAGYGYAYTTYYSSNPYAGLQGASDEQSFSDFLGTRSVEDILNVGREAARIHSNLILMGHSYGGYMAALIASRDFDRSSFKKIIGYATAYSGSRYDVDGNFINPEKNDPLSFAPQLAVPYLSIHGDKDINTPYDSYLEWKRRVEDSGKGHLLHEYIYTGGHALDRSSVMGAWKAIERFLDY